MKIQSKGNQVFNIPNNEEGKLFIQLAKKFLNPKCNMRNRGRGTRKHAGNQASIPLKHAEWLAMYIEQPDKYKKMYQEQISLFIETKHKMKKLENKIQEASSILSCEYPQTKVWHS